MTGKNLRLLDREHSTAWQPSIHEIISELQAELEKGEAVYSREELGQLARKLEEYEFTLQRLIGP
jgi:hypothetical protein